MDDHAKGVALNQIGYGLYVIGSRAGDEFNGMTANWVTQVSFEPPLILIAIQNDSKTKELIEKGKVFSINLIPAGGRGCSPASSSTSGGWATSWARMKSRKALPARPSSRWRSVSSSAASCRKRPPATTPFSSAR